MFCDQRQICTELLSGDSVHMRTFQKSFRFQFNADTSQFSHSLVFCFRAGHRHVSASLLSGWVDVVTGKDTQCPYSVTLSYWLWLAPTHAFKPYSTANKSLSSDTIQEKVCSRSLAQPLSVFGLNLFWYSPFTVAGCLTWKDIQWCSALMVWILIKLI